jgi:hypothetical protein
MANCSNEDFLLDPGHAFIRHKLEGEHFFTGAMATCRFLLCQYDIAKSSFAQIFNYLKIAET